jgi:hypothetical protein
VSEESIQHNKIARKKKELTPEEKERAIRASRSPWPFLLAVAVFVALTGVVTHPIVLAIGAVLMVVAIVGWGLERR